MKFPKDFRWKPTGKTLGQGGQGQIYEVIDQSSTEENTYALKALSHGKPQKAYERFYREISAIKELSHPFIIRILDHSELNDSFHYYVMEFIEGSESLEKLIGTDNNPFRGRSLKALNLFQQIVEALFECEQQTPRIHHRDLSPNNILILPDNTIKIIDFGLCQIEQEETITLIDEGVGTRNYAAPECEAGIEGTIDTYSDLYSAGKIIWSAITNQRAFAREKPVFTFKSMKSIFPEQPETWHLQLIFENTIRQNSADRWQTAEQALSWCRKIRFLVISGFPSLELISEICPICGIGKLGNFQGSHIVFGNPNPGGIVSLQCNYCGYCFAVNRRLIQENLKAKKSYE